MGDWFADALEKAHRKDVPQNKGRYLIGIDESGTGSWAGPFCVAAVVLPYHSKIEGVKDSKQLSDKVRRKLCLKIDKEATYWAVQDVEVKDIETHGQGEAWCLAILALVQDVLDELKKMNIVYGRTDVMIDGSMHHRLRDRICEHVQPGLRVYFEKKADSRHCSVAAASILAKTARNDVMNELHEQHPEYGWKKNAGYGTEEHSAALKKHGRTEHHRPLVDANGQTKKQRKKNPWRSKRPVRRRP